MVFGDFWWFLVLLGGSRMPLVVLGGLQWFSVFFVVSLRVLVKIFGNRGFLVVLSGSCGSWSTLGVPRTAKNHNEPQRTTKNHQDHQEPPITTKNHEKTPRTTKNHQESPRTAKNPQEPPKTTKNQQEPPRKKKPRQEHVIL